MKFSLLILLISVLHWNSFAQGVSSNDPDKAKMDSVIQRVRKGEKAAILDEANMRPELVVPALYLTARNKSTDPEKAEYARQALSKIKGVEDYLKKKIDEQSGKQAELSADERNKQMEILGLVRTNKAIRTIATYLFDDKNPGYSDGDYGVASSKSMATILLDRMKLPGAPSTVYNTEDVHIAAWRAWWLKNQNKFGDDKPYTGNQ